MRISRLLPGLVLALVWLVPPAPAQAPYRISDKEMERLLKDIEKGAETFRSKLKNALDHSAIDDTRAEKEIKRLLADFDKAAEKLKDKYSEKNSASSVVEEVLRRAAMLDRFMEAHPFAPDAAASWVVLRGKLDELARAYGVTMDWRTLS
jgi:hypothetical protein